MSKPFIVLPYDVELAPMDGVLPHAMGSWLLTSTDAFGRKSIMPLESFPTQADVDAFAAHIFGDE